MPVRPEKQTLYTKVWSDLYDEYSCGFLVSERGPQAELYAKLRMEIPHARIIVEPTWETIGGKTCRPDLVVVEGGRITDVFELKFAPHYYPRWKDDVAKLRRYVAESGKYPVSLDKTTGHWVNYLSVDQNCLLHFVAVGHWEAEAVSLEHETIPEVSHWRGPTGECGGQWEIRFA